MESSPEGATSVAEPLTPDQQESVDRAQRAALEVGTNPFKPSIGVEASKEPPKGWKEQLAGLLKIFKGQ